MMMDCPRCGFAQPKDRYCANCGLDVDHYVAKPKPVWVRLAQNSNLQLSLIGLFLLLIVGYLLLTRGADRQMEALLGGLPISSRDAGDPAMAAASQKAEAPLPEKAMGSQEPIAEVSMVSESAAQAAPATDKPSKFEVSSFEIPRKALESLMAGSEKVMEANEGRVYLWKDGDKVAAAVQSAGTKLSAPRNSATQLKIETPPTATENFQFGIYFQLAPLDSGDLMLSFDSTLVMRLADGEPPSQNPVVKPLTETSMAAGTAMSAHALLMILIEPNNRTIRDEYINRAGEGPWTVFNSEEFRNGQNEWVMLVQLK